MTKKKKKKEDEKEKEEEKKEEEKEEEEVLLQLTNFSSKIFQLFIWPKYEYSLIK
jgi:ribosomal protein L12E/L44/L45/RPP1/RPP2